MRVAVLSDIHDHVWNLQAVLGALPDARADALILRRPLLPLRRRRAGAALRRRDLLRRGRQNRGDEGIAALEAGGHGDRFRRLGPFAELVEVDGALLRPGRSTPPARPVRRPRARRPALRRQPLPGDRPRRHHHRPARRRLLRARPHLPHRHGRGGRAGGDGEPQGGGRPCPANPPEARDVPATFAVYDTATRKTQGYRVQRLSRRRAGRGGPAQHIRCAEVAGRPAGPASLRLERGVRGTISNCPRVRSVRSAPPPCHAPCSPSGRPAVRARRRPRRPPGGERDPLAAGRAGREPRDAADLPRPRPAAAARPGALGGRVRRQVPDRRRRWACA